MNDKRIRARPFPRPGRFVPILLLGLLCTLAIVAAGVALYMLYNAVEDDRKMWGVAFIGALGAFVLFRIIRGIMEVKITCPLCHGTVLKTQRCRKHRDAHRIFFLSFRKTMIVDLVTRLRFNCMYCGTPFRLRR